MRWFGVGLGIGLVAVLIGLASLGFAGQRLYHIPTYHTGYARSAATAAFPHAWRGLIGLWSFGLGPTGLEVRDHSGAQLHGTFTSALTASSWVVGEPGYTVQFTGGATERVEIGDFPRFDLDTMTVCAYVLTDETSRYNTAVARLQATVDGAWTLGQGSSSNTFRLLVRAGAAWVSAQSGTGFQANRFMALAGVWDRNTARLYVDGIQRASASGSTQTLNPTTTELRIGQRESDSDTAWSGLISIVLLYDRVLPPAMIALLAQVPHLPLIPREEFVAFVAAAPPAVRRILIID